MLPMLHSDDMQIRGFLYSHRNMKMTIDINNFDECCPRHNTQFYPHISNRSEYTQVPREIQIFPIQLSTNVTS